MTEDRGQGTEDRGQETEHGISSFSVLQPQSFIPRPFSIFRPELQHIADGLALAIMAAVAIVAGLTFRDYGLGWDDYTHAEYADLLLRMYGSGFKDTGALSFANLYMYG